MKMREEDEGSAFLVVSVTANPPTIRLVGPVDTVTVWRIKAAVNAILHHSKGWSKVVRRPAPHWLIRFEGEYADVVVKQSLILLQVIEVLHSPQGGRWHLLETSATSSLPSVPGGNILAMRHQPGADTDGGVTVTNLFFKRKRETLQGRVMGLKVVPPLGIPSSVELSTYHKGSQENMRELRTLMQGIEAGKVMVNVGDSDQRTPLHLACAMAGVMKKSEARETIMFLLEMGANPMLVDNYGDRPVDIVTSTASGDGNVAFEAFKCYADFSVQKQLHAPAIPAPIAELQHDVIAHATFSKVVPCIVYYTSVTNCALCCRDLSTNMSTVLVVFSSPPPPFLLVPYSEHLHSGRPLDIALLGDGRVLSINHTTSDPVVCEQSVPVTFDSASHGAPLAAFMWLKTSEDAWITTEAGRVGKDRRLKPSYLDSMKREICELEEASSQFQSGRRRKQSTDPSHNFARDMLLYPYLDEAKKRQPQEEALLSDETEDVHELPASPPEYVAVLCYVTSADKSTRAVSLHLPPFDDLEKDPLVRVSRTLKSVHATMRTSTPDKNGCEEGGERGEEVAGHQHRLPKGTLVTSISFTPCGRYAVMGTGEGYAIYSTDTQEFLYAATSGAADEEAEEDPEKVVVECGDQLADAQPPKIHRVSGLPSPTIAVSKWQGRCYYALFSHTLEVYSMEKGEGGIAPGRLEFRLSPMLETSSGCFHPLHPNLLIFLRNGLLCWFDLRTKVTGTVGPMRLTAYEVGRKQKDKDFPPDETLMDAVSGMQEISFASDGSCLLRFNTLYGNVAVYDWGEVHKCMKEVQAKIAADTTYLDIPGLALSHCIPHQRLRAYLAKVNSCDAPMNLSLKQLAELCEAIAEVGISPNFRDGSGRTALHIACELGCSTGSRAARDAYSSILWLLHRGANPYLADLAGQRPVDIAILPSYYTNKPAETTAQRAIMDYRRYQDDHRMLRREIPVIAESMEPCDHLAFSAVFEPVVYFFSHERHELLTINLEMEFSGVVLATPSPVRMVVFPYSQTLHEHNDRDYILLSDGTLLSVSFPNGTSATPVVESRKVAYRAELYPGMLAGACMAVTAVHRKPGVTGDYTMGVVGAVSERREPGEEGRVHKEIRVLHLSSVLFPYDSTVRSRLDFLEKAINMAANSGSVSCSTLEVPPAMMLSQMAAVNSPSNPEGVVVVAMEGLSTDERTNGYLLHNKQFIPFVSRDANVQWQGTTVGCAVSQISTDAPLVAAKFSRSVEVYNITDILESPSDRDEVKCTMEIPSADTLSEVTSGAFHPVHTHLLAFMKEGELCIYDSILETVTVVTTLYLSPLETKQKASDGDDASDGRITGVQSLHFSAKGMYMVRLNHFFKSFVVYAWSDIDRAYRSSRPTQYMSYLSAFVDRNLVDLRPPRPMELKGWMKRVATKKMAHAEKLLHLKILMEAIEAGVAPPSFQDTDGKTALHVLCDIAAKCSEGEVVRRALWLLEKGASLHICDSDGIRPIDICCIGGVGRGYILKAIKIYEERHILLNEPPPPMKGCFECPDHVMQALPSSVDPEVVYMMVPAHHPDTVLPFDVRSSASSDWCIVAYNVKSHRRQLVHTGPTSRERSAFYVVPYGEVMHMGAALDFLLLNTGELITVKFTPSGIATSVAEQGGVTFWVGSEMYNIGTSTYRGAPPGVAMMWVERGGQESEGEESQDMLGAISTITRDDSGRLVLRVQRMPYLEHNDTSKARYLQMLLQLSSPVDVALPEDIDSLCDSEIAITGSWNRSSGAFVVSFADKLHIVLSHRGQQKEVHDTIPTVPGIGTARVVSASRAGHHFVCATRPGGAEVYELVRNTANNVSFKLLWKTVDVASDSVDCAAVAVHPAQPIAIFLIDNELIALHLTTFTAYVIDTVVLSDAEIKTRMADGDGDGDTIVGEQAIHFTRGGRYLVRHNLFLGRAVAYSWDAVDSHLISLGCNPLCTRNAIHLSSLCERNPQATYPPIKSYLQPLRHGNLERKESSRGVLGRMYTAASTEHAKKTELLKMVQGIMWGLVGANFTDADGRTALHLVCDLSLSLPSEEAHATTLLLMKTGASLYLCDKDGMTPPMLLHPGQESRMVLQPILEYHIRYFETSAEDAMLSRTPPGCLLELPLTCTQVAMSAVDPSTAYCVSEHDGSVFVYACSVRSKEDKPYRLFASTELNGSSCRIRVFPRVAGRDDFIFVCDGTLLGVRYKEDGTGIEEIGQGTLTKAYKVHEDEPVGFACCVKLTEVAAGVHGTLATVRHVEDDVMLQTIAISADFQSDDLRGRIDTLTQAINGSVGEDVRVGASEDFRTVDMVFGSGGDVVLATRSSGALVATSGAVRQLANQLTSDERLVALAGGEGQESRFLAVLCSRRLEVHDVRGASNRRVLFIDDDSEVPITGCFHPTQRHLFVFCKDQDLCVVDFRRSTVRILLSFQAGERETRKAGDVLSMSILEFNADGTILLRLNVHEEIATAYSWDDIMEHANKLNEHPDVVNNAVFLPHRLAGIDLSDVYQQALMTTAPENGP